MGVSVKKNRGDMASLGYSGQIINPEVGTLMSGFAPLRAYRKKHSDLWLRAFVIEDSCRTLFLQFDTIAIDEYLFRQIKRIADGHGIAEDHLIVSASHTHSGPVGLVNTQEGIFKGIYGLFGNYDQEMVSAVLAKTDQLIAEAIKNLEEISTLKFARGNLKGIGTERHDPKLPGDDRLTVWSYQTISGRKYLFYNFACHPTILNGTSEFLSSDFPGATAELLQREYQAVCFINGSCGDISTRFTRTTEGRRQIEIFAELLTEKIVSLSKDQLLPPGYGIRLFEALVCA